MVVYVHLHVCGVLDWNVCSLNWIRVRSAIEMGRSPVEQQLKEQVQLHRWDDTNYYALKAAVTKSQSTLAKFSRAYLVRLVVIVLLSLGLH